MSNENESKNAAASQEGIPTFVGQVQANPDTIPSPCSVPLPTTITREMQNHRHMVCHQLEAKHVAPSDQERFVSEFFVFEPNASEQAAMDRICTYFGIAPDNKPRRLPHDSPQVNDDYIRAVIRNGLQYGYILDHDIRGLIAEQIVPLGEAGLASSRSFINIVQCLMKFAIPIRVNSVDSDGNVKRYIAQRKPEGFVDFVELHNNETTAEVGESDQPQTSNSCTSESQAQKKVNHTSPVSGEPSDEKVDEDDGHGSNPSETLQSDDLGDQDTEPTSCGSQTRSDTIVELDYDEHDRMTLALCKAVEQSILAKQRVQKQLNQALLKIDQCLAKKIGEMKDQIE
ncbi:hypothetical protein FAGAP_2275 [Fusarium agapanthi]|uniref:Uncharacterized protein n=1 Tax=Fusarium agapanthi TaxID=1803897 RepID=A0A9P5BGD5_9HYPO|nr:hypothetical protein FAGAP_2275 [Fusarium agapanthi]